MDKDARNKLLEAAQQLFSMKGYEAVSLRDLAEASDVNTALISYHFGGKQGLYDAVLEANFHAFFEGLNVSQCEKLEPEERVLEFVKNIIAVHKRNPYLRNIMNSELSRPSESFEKIIMPKVAELYKFFSATIREGIDKGYFRKDLDPVLAPLAVIGLIQFYFVESAMIKRIFPVSENVDEDFGAQVVKIYFDGIRNQEKR